MVTRKRRKPPDEQVRQARVSLIRKAQLILDGRAEDALIIDLGLKGVFVERAELLPADARVKVSFLLPGNELPVVAECRVAWRHAGQQPLRSKQLPAGIGLEFVQMDEADERRLRVFLTEHFARTPRARQFTRPWIDEDEEPTL